MSLVPDLTRQHLSLPPPPMIPLHVGLSLTLPGERGLDRGDGVDVALPVLSLARCDLPPGLGPGRGW